MGRPGVVMTDAVPSPSGRGLRLKVSAAPSTKPRSSHTKLPALNTGAVSNHRQQTGKSWTCMGARPTRVIMPAGCRHPAAKNRSTVKARLRRPNPTVQNFADTIGKPKPRKFGPSYRKTSPRPRSPGSWTWLKRPSIISVGPGSCSPKKVGGHSTALLTRHSPVSAMSVPTVTNALLI